MSQLAVEVPLEGICWGFESLYQHHLYGDSLNGKTEDSKSSFRGSNPRLRAFQTAELHNGSASVSETEGKGSIPFSATNG